MIDYRLYIRNVIILCVLFFLVSKFGPQKLKHYMEFTSKINFLMEYPEIDPEKCIKTAILNEGIQTMICIKPRSRSIESKRLESIGTWEGDIVNSVINAMVAHPSAVFLDVGANIGMFTLVIAAMKRKVISVDADPQNLAYIRQSLEIAKNRDYVELIYNAISDKYETLYPYTHNKKNEMATTMFTKEQIDEMNVVTEIPPLMSIRLEDIVNYIDSDIIILKIDIEGYECKALQQNIVLNKLGKFIPYIFMEWKFLPNHPKTCPNFEKWVQHFYDGGYLLFNPEKMVRVDDNERDKMIDVVWVHSSVIIDMENTS